MIRFITNILLVSLFFTGLGAIADGVLKFVIPTKNQFAVEQKSECEMQRIKVIRFPNTEKQTQIQMILPKIDEVQQFEKPIAQKRVLILKQSEIIE